MPSMSGRASFPQEWQPYSTTRSSPIGESTKSDYTGEVEPYVLEGQVQDPRFNHTITTMNLATNHMDFNIASASTLSPLESYPPTYASNIHQIKDRDDLSQNLQPASPYTPSRSIPVPGTTDEVNMQGVPPTQSSHILRLTP